MFWMYRLWGWCGGLGRVFLAPSWCLLRGSRKAQGRPDLALAHHPHNMYIQNANGNYAQYSTFFLCFGVHPAMELKSDFE